jgi:Protein of unknown function (DUF3237)
MADTTNDSPDRNTIPVEFIGTLDATTQAVTPVAVAGTTGTRVTVTVTEATFVGPRINATAVPGVAGGDWPLVRSDGTLVLDVRLNLRTDDGADIFVSYAGIGTPIGDGMFNIRTAPTFQTGDPRYAWLNNVMGVGIGKSNPTGVVYDIYAVQ